MFSGSVVHVSYEQYICCTFYLVEAKTNSCKTNFFVFLLGMCYLEEEEVFRGSR